MRRTVSAACSLWLCLACLAQAQGLPSVGTAPTTSAATSGFAPASWLNQAVTGLGTVTSTVAGTVAGTVTGTVSTAASGASPASAPSSPTQSDGTGATLAAAGSTPPVDRAVAQRADATPIDTDTLVQMLAQTLHGEAGAAGASGEAGDPLSAQGQPPIGEALPGGNGGTMSLMAPQTGTGAAFAEYHPTVVELYTSQGCSACPPADALLGEFAGRDDVIALALHVDYWDYIGWTDSFGNAAFTRRQKAYARAAAEHAIYTPQMIVEGSERLVGLRPRELVDLIGSHAATPSQIRLNLTRMGDTVRIEALARPALAGPVSVQLVRYLPRATVDIRQGENQGRNIRYANIVTSWTQLQDWDGRSPLSLDAPAPGSEPVVVILQQPGPGPILAAERLR